jgi:hypothetical protein
MAEEFILILYNILPQHPLFSFIPFFNGNECGTYGKDIYISENKFTNSPISYSYTTTHGTNRANQNGTNKDEWFNTLPSPFMRIVNNNNENAFDSFGCGINENFPCYSFDWTDNHPLPVVEEEIIDLGSYKNNIIYVDEEEGSNEKHCGTLLLPCSSLSYSSSHFGLSEIKEMKILSSSIHNSSFSSSKTVFSSF